MAALVAKLKPLLTVGTGVMSKGAVDLAILLSLLSAGIIQPDLFSLIVFGFVIMILATSMALKKRIMLGSAATGEVAKKMSIETATDTLTPLNTRTVLGDLRVRNVYTKGPPARLRRHDDQAIPGQAQRAVQPGVHCFDQE